MKLKVRYLSLIAAVCLAVTTLCGFSSASAEIDDIGTIIESVRGTKIAKNLQDVLDKSNDADLIPVYIWINDIDYNLVERKTLYESGFSKDSLIEKSSRMYEPLIASVSPDVMEISVSQESVDTNVSHNYNITENITKAEQLSILQNFYSDHEPELKELSDNVNLYVDTNRKFAKEAYNKENGEFTDNYLKNAKIIFQSEYAPMIICKISKNAILYLNTLDCVESLSLYEEMELTFEGNMDISVKSINGYYVKNSLGFDGSGVKVGQIEPGIPELGISELRSTKITRHNTSGYHNHSSIVAAIIAGDSGMAPGAELYCTLNEDFYKDVEWLISSGVSVINMSAGASNSGTYDDCAKWVDHVVYQHNVSFVKSAGNDGETGYVSSPGNAYNVITVGGIDDNGTVKTSDDTFYTGTSIKTGSSMPSKPDVVAPGVGFSVAGRESRNGTSYSAPHVTGMIAQMMSFCPTLKVRPDAIKAAVAASCDRKTTRESLSRITNQEGSGVVNAINAVNSISNTISK